MNRINYRELGRLLGLLVLTVFSCQAQPLAFPGAEGFGRFTSGGRGGTVFEVTNLNDSGPGSLRAAIEASGPRTVVFRVSGNIVLKSELAIVNGNLTIAGQTAPGDGICIRDYPLNIYADNIIIRFIRVRLGDIHKLSEDATSCYFQKDIIIDHCSFSWGIDEVLTVRDNENTTVQWCLISESLYQSFHHKGKHGYGGIWGGMGASFHHNLMAHHTSRNPRFNGSRYHNQPEKEIVDYRNNVIYNWGFNSAYGGENGKQNVIANYYKSGPATKHRERIVAPGDTLGEWFISGNYIHNFPEISADNWAGGIQGKFQNPRKMVSPYPAAPVITQSAEEAYEKVLTNVGAIFPRRDSLDARIIREVRNGTATYGGTWGAGSGIIDSQEQVGGWPVLHTALPPQDQDHDGMPDVWEEKNGLNSTDPSDRNGDRNADGYTNLENYLNELVAEIKH